MSTFVTQPDSTTGVDTYVISSGPTNNEGSADPIFFGIQTAGKSTSVFRSLLEFDLSPLSGGNVSVSAIKLDGFTDDVSTDNVTNSNGQFAMYRVKTETSPWTQLGATWNVYSTGNSWVTAGGDYDTTNKVTIALATVPALATASFTIPSDVNFVAIAQDAIDKRAGRLSLIIKHDGETGATEQRAIDTCAYATSSRRPKITVTYTGQGGPKGKLLQVRQAVNRAATF